MPFLACLGQFLVILDVSVMNVALPPLREGLGMSAAALQWVTIAYVIPFSGFMLLFGRLGDLLGQRTVFIAGMSLFTLASLGGGLAQQPWQIIAARAVQGLGSAAVAPVTLTLVSTAFSEAAARSRAIGTWAAVASAGGAAGCLVGGLLVQYLSWRSVLLINVPVGLVVLAGSLAWLSRTRPAGTAKLDVPGAVLVCAGLAATTYGISRSETLGRQAAGTLLPLAAGLVLLALFVMVEARTAAPLMPLRLFADRGLRAATVGIVPVGVMFVVMWFFLNLYAQNLLHYSPLQAGLSFLPHSLAIVVASKTAARLAQRTGTKTVIAAGLAITAAGSLWQCAAMTVNGTYLAAFLLPGLVMSLGLGYAATALTSLTTSSVAAEDTGAASGINNTARQMGGALGLSVLSAVVTAHTRQDASTASPAQLAEGYGLVFLITACLFALATLIMLAMVPSRAGETPR
ncbi:MFS transporter [Streptomyces sp. NRRL S-1448]|uniref:MFS transporter n=1 Tax=Streptomyces sp. NRRL S-1448 TaxID=1463883 RepID=UPI000AF51166|nr:MFS transporter [Streptomyces sp. NRRL S-1448]